MATLAAVTRLMVRRLIFLVKPGQTVDNMILAFDHGNLGYGKGR